MYLFSGIAPGLDLIVGGGGAFEGGAFAPSTLEIMPRLFLSPEVDLALVGHLFLESGSRAVLGPEIHVSGYPTDALGLWVNAGASYALAPGAEPETFAWFGLEITDDRPFLALELDLGSSGPIEATATLIPSAGVWLGPQGETGVSAGWLLPLDGGPLGLGVWLWQGIDLRSSQSRLR